MSTLLAIDDSVELEETVKYSLGKGHEAELHAGAHGKVADVAYGEDGTQVLVSFRTLALILWVSEDKLRRVYG
jgi:hypothetical protein